MQDNILILSIIVLVVLALLIALFVAFKREKPKTYQEKEFEIPNATKLLELLKDPSNNLNTLEKYAKYAHSHYAQYMQEVPDFDLEFVAILTAHKGVNAKLVLEIEKKFKALNPERKALLDKALSVGLGHR